MAKAFSGALGIPVFLRSPVELALAYPGISTEEAQRRELDSVRYLINKKMVRLLEYYDIDQLADDPFFDLSLNLAFDFVPGFQIYKPGYGPRRKGRPGKWKGALGVELYRSVKKIVRERKKGVTDAIRRAKDRDPKRWGNFSVKELQARYYEILRLEKPNGDLPAFMLAAWLTHRGSESHGK